MSAPLYDKLNKYKTTNNYPFHMPGHKCGRGLKLDNILKMDITEINGFDNLHCPQGIILDAEKLCAETFGAKHTFFLVNGSSCGIQAAIMSVCNEGDKIITARNCHKSVYSGFIFSGAEPIYVIPEIVESYGLTGGVTPQSIENCIKENLDAKAVIVTSPTYEGFVSDIRKIAEIVHRNDMILIVDEAHGAHMHFHRRFPQTALECGADIVIESIHKTLPSMTQTALLHVNGNRADLDRIKFNLTLVQSSSPSYVLMASIDKCRNMLDENGLNMFHRYSEFLSNFISNTECLKNIKLITRSIAGKYGIKDFDESKLVFYVNKKDFTGIQLEKELIDKYNIQLEMSGIFHAVALTSVSDTEEGFVRLETALNEINLQIDDLDDGEKFYWRKPEIPKVRINPRKAAFLPKTSVPLKESIGMTCGEFIIPYPPGIPLIVPGEIINSEVVDSILNGMAKGIDIIGAKDHNLNYIQIL